MTERQPGDTVLAFGDSITYGFGAAPDESYPSVLASLTDRRVINAGINGETSEEGLARLPALLEDESIDLMILCFGTNDIFQRRSMPRLKRNLERMISMGREKGIEVILLATPTLGAWELSPLPLYEEAAEASGAECLPELLSDVIGDPGMRIDEVHPNAAGYRKIAEAIFDVMKRRGWIKPAP